MRLLSTVDFSLKNVGDPSDIKFEYEYAILSHRWGEEEVSFQDIQDLTIVRQKKGFKKIEGMCTQAKKDGFEWVWIDSCMINKESSAELDLAIRSMWQWYRGARVCYAYLQDVEIDQDRRVSSFKTSVWFSRGWTLQELIAPTAVVFYAAEWVEFGTKTSLRDLISEITRIPTDILLGKALDKCNAAEKLSWASDRTTTVAEDKAYCLLGLMDVNIPLLYGEGGDKAFLRLQMEVLRTTFDFTLYAWKYPSSRGMLLATDPSDFRPPPPSLDWNDANSWEYSNLISAPLRMPTSIDVPVQFGKTLVAQLAVSEPKGDLVFLNCRLRDPNSATFPDNNLLLCRKLHSVKDRDGIDTFELKKFQLVPENEFSHKFTNIRIHQWKATWKRMRDITRELVVHIYFPVCLRSKELIPVRQTNPKWTKSGKRVKRISDENTINWMRWSHEHDQIAHWFMFGVRFKDGSPVLEVIERTSDTVDDNLLTDRIQLTTHEDRCLISFSLEPMGPMHPDSVPGSRSNFRLNIKCSANMTSVTEELHYRIPLIGNSIDMYR
jgi:heterokaryon incompatibility protein (HET)